MRKWIPYLFIFTILWSNVQCTICDAAKINGAYHFGFRKGVKGKPPCIDDEGFKPILQKNEAIFLGDTKQKELYLTFDNGFENGYTPKILDVLKDKKVQATFFVTGHYLKDKPEIVKRMAADGHIVGNHSWNHPDMTKVSNEKLKKELDLVKAEVDRLTGQKTVFLRPPRGIFNQRTLAETKRLGYVNVFWSVAYLDWDINHQRGQQYAYEKIMSQLHPGAVLLLHSVSKDNAKVLGRIIDDARARGYVFKSLNDLKTKTY